MTERGLRPEIGTLLFTFILTAVAMLLPLAVTFLFQLATQLVGVLLG